MSQYWPLWKLPALLSTCLSTEVSRSASHRGTGAAENCACQGSDSNIQNELVLPFRIALHCSAPSSLLGYICCPWAPDVLPSSALIANLHHLPVFGECKECTDLYCMRVPRASTEELVFLSMQVAAQGTFVGHPAMRSHSVCECSNMGQRRRIRTSASSTSSLNLHYE